MFIWERNECLIENLPQPWLVEAGVTVVNGNLDVATRTGRSVVEDNTQPSSLLHFPSRLRVGQGSKCYSKIDDGTYKHIYKLISTSKIAHAWCKRVQEYASSRSDRSESAKDESARNRTDANGGAPTRSTTAVAVTGSAVVGLGAAFRGGLVGGKRLVGGGVDGEDHA